jgi:hypothetical protein
VGAAALTLDVFLFRAVCANQLASSTLFQASARGRRSGEWTASAVRSLRRTSPTIDSHSAGGPGVGTTREAVIETAVQRLDLSQKQAGEAYGLADTFEQNPRSVWGYVQGLTRLSQRTPWQDGRFVLDRAAGRLLTAVN